VDSALRELLLRALGFDLAIAANCGEAAEDLIAGASWWERATADWRP
jgi:hypothetical protein